MERRHALLMKQMPSLKLNKFLIFTIECNSVDLNFYPTATQPFTNFDDNLNSLDYYTAA